MKKNILLLVSLLLTTFIFLVSCDSDVEVSDGYVNNGDYTHEVLPLFSDDDYAIISNSLTLPNKVNVYQIDLPQHSGGGKVSLNSMKAMLGRVLFYDKDLSIDRTTSCASCHKQELAFSDDVAFSKGVNDNLTDRNSIAIGSFVSVQHHYGGGTSSSFQNNKLFWDGRANNFIDQMNQTFTNPKEMGMTFSQLEQRAREKDIYEVLFKKAFDDGVITSSRIKSALSEFMKAFHSNNSFFDKALNNMGPGTDLNQDFIKFTLNQNKGKNLFNANCKSCHGSSLKHNISVSTNFANTGLDMDYEDQGIGEISANNSSNGKFKVPSLRNIEVTGPYMHDGRFETLEEVVDFYNDDIQPHPNLHHLLKDTDGNPKKLNLTESEKQSLVEFLKTLTDDNLLMSSIYSDPFK